MPVAPVQNVSVTLAEDRLMSINEIARLVGVTPRYMWSKVAAGAFPGPDFRIGRLAKWRASTVERWLSAQAA